MGWEWKLAVISLGLVAWIGKRPASDALTLEDSGLRDWDWVLSALRD